MTAIEKAVEWAVATANDNEEWRPVKGFPGYYVSNKGRVLGISGRVLKPSKPCSYMQYYSVCLKRDGKDCRRTIHRLVAEAFIQNPYNFPFVNHKDEDKLNNCVDNLEWCDSKYNNNYGENMRRARRKVAAARSKAVEMITDDGAVLFESIRDAARKTGINRNCISWACSGLHNVAGGFKWRYAV